MKREKKNFLPLGFCKVYAPFKYEIKWENRELERPGDIQNTLAGHELCFPGFSPSLISCRSRAVLSSDGAAADVPFR